jgi:hypothetical protein
VRRFASTPTGLSRPWARRGLIADVRSPHGIRLLPLALLACVVGCRAPMAVEAPVASTESAGQGSDAGASIPSSAATKVERHPAAEEAQFGMIGLISDLGDGGREESNVVGETRGLDEPSEVDTGMGGDGQGIGLGNLGRLGHGPLGGYQQAHAKVHEGTATVSGALPIDVIRRIIHENLGRFRLCYEREHKNDPKPRGHIDVKFIIDRDGSVSHAEAHRSDLPDRLVQCVVRSVEILSFPQPEGDTVTVVYPIRFEPADGPGDGASPPSASAQSPSASPADAGARAGDIAR